jgi:glycosyltransferase involved in cell wall biosynthesis
MITPRVDPDHDVFGFIHSWVDKLSEKVDKLHVITFGVGRTNLRDNVEVYSACSKTQVGKLLELNKLLFKLTPKVNVVFTHMYPWLPIVAFPHAKLFRKPLVMFNAHGHVDLKKRLAASLADKVVTSSKKGFNIDTPKKGIVGQGINTKVFKSSNNKPHSNTFEIISTGRIGRVKGYDFLIKALDVLVSKKNKNTKLKIIGPVHDKKYYKELNAMIGKYNLTKHVSFSGAMPFSQIANVYKSVSLYASHSTTGSLDKTTLEAMACELPIVVCNEAFLDIFDDEMKEKCFFRKGNYLELAEKIEHFMNNNEEELKKRSREIVVKNHNVDFLIDKLVSVFEGMMR